MPDHPPHRKGAFDALDPQTVFAAVEQAFDIKLDGSLERYRSYVNRVYGLRTDSGVEYVVKFYRPGRWDETALEAEHDFVLECAAAELPVVAPLVAPDGWSLQHLDVAVGEHTHSYPFALYPKHGGRGFDAEGDEDWFRLGALAGRIHRIGATTPAPERLRCTPTGSTSDFVAQLDALKVVHADVAQEFFALAAQGIELIAPLFEGVRLQRIHGDLHRGNVLERGNEGLLLIDFDDMMMGPPVQDLWLLLPDRAQEAGRELTHIIDGYSQFAEFEPSSLRLIEPLRFMRMLYYLAWSALQSKDYDFHNDADGWGSRAFWIREVEDLRTQLQYVVAAVRG